MIRRRPDLFGLLCTLVDAHLSGAPTPPEVVANLADPRLPWRRLVRLTGVHLLTPAFATCLDELDLAEGLEADLRSYLAAMREAGEARNRGLRADLLRIAKALNAVGIEPVLLKGALRLTDGLFPDDTWRFMHDLDLLVPEATTAEARRALEGLGWPAAAGEEAGASRHELVLVRPDLTARLEVHSVPLEPPHAPLLPAAGLIARSEPLETAGARFRAPSPVDQAIHLVLHAQIQHGHLATGRLLLRDLAELALLARRHGPDLLDSARERLTAAGAALALDHVRHLAAACLPQTAPPAPPTGRLPAVLARRTLVLQRHPHALQIAGPAGHLIASLVRSDLRVPGPRQSFPSDLATFRRKTIW